MFMFSTAPDKFTAIQESKQKIEEGRYSLNGDPVVMQSYTIYGKDQGKPMSRDFCISVHHKLHKLSVEYIKEIKQNPGQQFGLSLLQQVLGDKLYAETGVESNEHDAATEFLHLEDDAEYKQMCADYTAQVMEVNQQY